jgi:carboxyl-terminal processing protease
MYRIVITLVLLAVTSSAMPEPAPAVPVSWEDARLLAEILQRVREQYVLPVDDRTLMRRAADGMVTGLDDYSVLLDRNDYQELLAATSGTYAGIGVEIETANRLIRIVRVIEDSPAAKAGLRAGDVVQSIDGVPVKIDNLDATTNAMRGEPGSAVTLSLLRDGQALSFTVKRSVVELNSVASEYLAPGYGYLRISSFTDTTGTEFDSAVQALRAANSTRLKALVIDLRNNPGGVMDAAVAVADSVLDAGLIVSGDGRTDSARFSVSATPGDVTNGAAIALLVNGNSASAAEILAAALHDNNRALLVGRKTYGKGSVQSILPLSDGKALKLTTSRYFTPRGESLDHRGIVPDVVLAGNESEPANLDPPGTLPTLAQRDREVGVALQRLRASLKVASAATAPARR